MKDAFSFGPFRLYPRNRVLQRNGTVVSLGGRAFDLLVAMVERNGTVLTPTELMAIVWPGLIVEDSNVRIQVAHLRRTLGCGRNGARYIASVAGRGYCFVEPVGRVESATHRVGAYRVVLIGLFDLIRIGPAPRRDGAGETCSASCWIDGSVLRPR